MCAFQIVWPPLPIHSVLSRKHTNNTAVGHADAGLDPMSKNLQVLAATETQIEAMSKTISDHKTLSQKKLIPNSVEINQTVVPLHKIDKAVAMISHMADDVGKGVVDDVVPLSGLNVQLKRVHGDTCMTVDRCQRWNLF